MLTLAIWRLPHQTPGGGGTMADFEYQAPMNQWVHSETGFTITDEALRQYDFLWSSRNSK